MIVRRALEFFQNLGFFIAIFREGHKIQMTSLVAFLAIASTPSTKKLWVADKIEGATLELLSLKDDVSSWKKTEPIKVVGLTISNL